MSRHAAPVSSVEHVRVAHLGSAAGAAALAVLFALASMGGRAGLLVVVLACQLLLVYAWMIGTAQPGVIGGFLTGAGTAVAADLLLYANRRDGLAPLLGVFGMLLVALLVHQLSRGVVRVRVIESMSGIVTLCLALASPSAYLVLAAHTNGEELVSAAVLACGAALLVGYLVDIVMPAPRFDEGIQRGLFAVAVSAVVGGAVGWFRLAAIADFGSGTAVTFGALLGLLTGLFGVGAAYLFDAISPRSAPFGDYTVAYLRVVFPFSLLAPLAYVIGIALTG